MGSAHAKALKDSLDIVQAIDNLCECLDSLLDHIEDEITAKGW